MRGPKNYIDWIESQLLLLIGAYSESASWGYTFSCQNIGLLPNFWLLFGDHWFEVRSADYIVKVNTAGTACALCLSAVGESTTQRWVLGNVFLRGWYSTHDYANMRFGFVAFKDSPKRDPVLHTNLNVMVPYEQADIDMLYNAYRAENGMFGPIP